MTSNMTAEDPLRALLVGDDLDDYLLVRDALNDAGRYHFHWERAYEAALRIAQEYNPEVVLVDYRLGTRSGLEFLQDLRANGCAAPVVLLTEEGEGRADLEAMRAGAADVLTKAEMGGRELERSIRYAVERHRAQLELHRAQWLAGVGAAAITLRHEINNPLAAMLADASLLETGGNTPEEEREMIESIVRQARRIGEAVGRLSQIKTPPVLRDLANGSVIIDLSSVDS